MSSCALGIATLALALPACAATAQRTFVSAHGNDANPCSIPPPCRGFAVALTQTSVAGEIIVLDSAGYGAVAINKSVSIIAPPGVYAGISVFAGNGITASGAGHQITLRGLKLNGQGTQDNTVDRNNGGVVLGSISNCGGT